METSVRHLNFKPLLSAVLGLSVLFSAATGALAQTKPKVTDMGDKPASAIYIGNSFFYYNNSLHQ